VPRLLCVTVGLPRAGQAAWAKRQGVPVVSLDAVRLAFQNRPFIQETEEWVWAVVRVMVRSLFFAGHDCVILESTFHLRRQREQWMSNDLWSTVFCRFCDSPGQCQEQAVQDNRPEMVPLIDRLANSFEEPDPDEGWCIDID
jgi:predicted kinase